VLDRGYGLTIIQVNPRVKEIYDYVMMSLKSNDCFVTSTSRLNGDYFYSFDSRVATRGQAVSI
jgi:predicted ATP-grasp superfamily ATP-dependent carboligase